MAYSVTALKRVKPRYAAVIMMTPYRFFLLISLLSLVLTACGQRGPLYLPDDSAPVVVPAQASQPPAAQPAVPAAPLDTDLKEVNKGAEDDLEDTQADGL